jgi:PhnB protein
MKKPVKPVPEDFRTITPHIVVRGVAKAVDFYRQAFGAEELYRNMGPDGVSIIHSELLLGDSRFFVNDEFPDHGVFAPEGERGTGVTLHLYVPDVDAFHARAVAAGVQVLLPLADYFWGDRYFILKDPFGHRWSVASRIEDLSPQEIHERAEAFFGNKPA